MKGRYRWLLLLMACVALFLPSQDAQASHGGPAVIGMLVFPKRDAQGIAVDPQNGRLYVGTSEQSLCPYPGDNGRVFVFDEPTLTMVGDVGTGWCTGALAVNGTINRIYAWQVNGVDIIDGSSHTVSTVLVPNCCIPGDVAVNLNTNRLYVPGGSDGLHVISGETNTTIAQVGVAPIAHRVAVNPTTNRVYVTNAEGLLYVVDGATNTVVTTISVGQATGGLAVNPETNRIYVGQFQGVSVIDGATNAVVANVVLAEQGQERRLAINTATNRIYVANKYGPSLSVINGTTNQVITTLQVTTPTAVAVNPNTNRVYVAHATNSVSIIADPNPGFHVVNFPAALRTAGFVIDLTQAGQTTDVVGYVGGLEARMLLRFSQVSGDIDFASSLTAETDFTNGKAVLHRLGGYPTGVGQRDLYVRRLVGHNRVRVCPNATMLSEVSSTCLGGILLQEGQASGGMSLSRETVGGQESWVVSNVAGTGAQGETAATATPTATPQPTATLPDPGAWGLLAVGLAVLGGYGAWRLWRKERRTL